MNYSYTEAETIIGHSRATIAHHAWKLGLARVGGGLDDDGLQAVWEAIETAQVRETIAHGPERETSDSNGLGCETEVGDSSTGTSSYLGPYEESPKSAESLLLTARGRREQDALSLHFSLSAIDAKTSPPTPSTDDDSRSEFSAVREPDIGDACLVRKRALLKLEVEIETREVELRTLRRARAVLARDVERDGSAVRCGDEAHRGA